MTSPTFFGGAGADLGTVFALTPTNFASFVKETLGNPVLLKAYSRSEFHAKDKGERDRIKRVAFFTPCAFKETRCRRAFENATHCNLVVLDIDDSKDAGPFVQRPQQLAELLHPFAFAAYTTSNSTPASPRLRVVVRAELLPVAQYTKAVEYIGRQLQLSKVTTESRVSVQPMFLPTLFRDDDPVDNHPLIIAVPEGAAVTASVVAGAAVPSGNPVPSSKDDPEDTSAESLAYLRPQVEGVEAADAADALKFLDPDCSYPEWIAVAAALKHQFDDAEGFKVFNDWSSKGSKYAGPEETKKKWDTFRQHTRGRAPVTIRSLLKKAAEAGWSHAEAVGGRCYEETRSWLNSGMRSAKDLMEQGVQRIVGTPLISDLQRGALLSCMYDALRRVGITITRTELKNSMRRFERKLAKQNAATPVATPDAQMPNWARGFTYVATQDEFFQRHTGRTFKPEVLDRYYSVQLMTPADEGSSTPSTKPRDFLLNSLKCPRVDDYAYDPSATEAVIHLGHKRAVNLYIPTHPDSDPNDADYAGSIVLNHLNNLIREPEYRQLLLDFLAYHVQFPGAKIRWATLVQGAMGCGKTTLLEMMRAVLGREHVKAIGAELLFSGYNGWAMGAQLVGIEEVRVVGHNRYEVMNTLKPCISNDYISINDKYVVPFETKNVSNYIMFTNHHDALAISKDDRRYFVLYSALQTRTQVKRLGEAYFDRLWDTIHNHAPGLRAFFEQHRISDKFNPDGHAPVTKYLEELARLSSSPLSSAIAELIEDRKHLLIQPDVLSVTALYSALESKRLPPYTEQAVGHVLRELGYDSMCRTSLDGTLHHLYAHRNAELDADLTRDRARERISDSDLLD